MDNYELVGRLRTIMQDVENGATFIAVAEAAQYLSENALTLIKVEIRHRQIEDVARLLAEMQKGVS